MRRGPENVHIVLKDGTTIACETYYLGRDQDGQHRWAVTADMPSLELIDHVTCDVLPARTSLVFRVGGDTPS